MKNLQNSVLTVTMAIGLAITGLTPAHASIPTITASQQEELQSTSIQAATVQVTYEKPTVVTTPAPAATAPVENVQPPTSESIPTVAKAAAAVAPVVAVPAPTPAPAKVAPPAPVPAPAVEAVPAVSGSRVASAALAQIGVNQDCTALVTNALAAVGIHFHGWPADYMSLGHVIPASAAQPGDLIYYANGGAGVAHIAVYIGNGQAVHGGFDGTTKVYSAQVGSGPVFIRLG